MDQENDTRSDRDRNRERIEELEAQVAELEALYRATPVAFCVIDRELRYLRVNDEYAAIVDRRPSDIIGHSMAEIVHEFARELAVGLVQTVINTGLPLRNLELPGFTRSTPPLERIWLLNAHPIKHNGLVTAVIGVMQDVTGPKQMERTARERLDVIDSLYRNAPIGLVFMDQHLRFQRVNEIVAGINGIPIEAHIGKSLQDVNPGLGPGPEEALRKLMTRGLSIRDVEVEVRPPTDLEHDHIYRLSCEALAAPDGSPLGLLGTVLDITEQARTERELKASHERAAAQLLELEALYEHAPAAICHIDRDARILRISKVMAHAHGLPIEDNLGRTVYELNPELISQIQPAIQRVLESGVQLLNVEVRGAPPSRPGRDYTWLMSLHPTFAPGARVDGAIVVIQDVTELKRQQAELEQVKRRLEEAQRITRIGSWEWNIVADTVWWSDELFEIMGKSRAGFAPTWNAFVDLVHPDDRLALRAQISATLDRDEPYWLEVRVFSDDSSVRTLLSAARLERGADGRPQRLIGTCQQVKANKDSPHRARPDSSGGRII